MAASLKGQPAPLATYKNKKRIADVVPLPLQHPPYLRGMQNGDARELARRLPTASIDVTITSPPYFDLKNYAAKGQIGYGQTYDAYLGDLTSVFKEVNRATKSDGSLWIVIDSFHRDQELLPLPFDLAAKLRDVGWSLRDVIIWKKERTLPWVHQGQTKRIFEYILVFSKAKQPFRYFADRLRDPSDLRRWWVRYPERYNPSGKALEEIWNFDIPVQGSWNKEHVRHFCPLPPDLVGRIVELTTNPGDRVLDPFAGTGSVLTETKRRGRAELGFEINTSYVTAFRKKAAKAARRISAPPPPPHDISQESFSELIKKLRLLKYGRLLFRSLTKARTLRIHRIFARRLPATKLPRYKILAAEYCIHIPRRTDRKKLAKKVRSILTYKPFSKFGIAPTVRIAQTNAEIPSPFRRGTLFAYGATNSHRFAKSLSFQDAVTSRFPLLSPIRVVVEEPDD